MTAVVGARAWFVGTRRRRLSFAVALVVLALLIGTATWWLPAARAALAELHPEYMSCTGCHV